MTEAVLNGKLPPPVRRSDGVIIPFDKELIVKSLLKETQLVKTLYGGTPMKEEDARKIADEVEEDIRSMKLRFLSGPLIRELERKAPRARLRQAEERLHQGRDAPLRCLLHRQLRGL